MKKIIRYIRNQPEEIKRHILHISTIILATVLFFLWIYSLGSGLTDANTQVKVKSDLEPFSALKATVIEGYDSILGSQ